MSEKEGRLLRLSNGDNSRQSSRGKWLQTLTAPPIMMSSALPSAIRTKAQQYSVSTIVVAGEFCEAKVRFLIKHCLQ